MAPAKRSASARKSRSKSESVSASTARSKSRTSTEKTHGDGLITTKEGNTNHNDNHKKPPSRGLFWHPPADETEEERKERLRPKDIEDASVPSYMYSTNPYILTGYRCHHSSWECLKSIFRIHNETGNIWTHFSYLCIVITLLWYFYTYHLEFSLGHYVVFTIFAIANIWVVGCSSVYHTMSGHEEESVFRVALMMDLAGIAVFITACFIPGIYWGMACFPFWRNLYLTMISILGSAAIATPLLDRHEKYASHNVRTALFTLTAVSGLIPSVHYLFLLPIGYGASTRLPLGGIALMFLQYAIGMCCYLAKFPERWFPGHFDTWLSSHQLWHIGVGNALLAFYHCVIRMYDIYTIKELDFATQC